MSELKIRRKAIHALKIYYQCLSNIVFVVGMYGLVRMYGDCGVT